MKLGGVLTWGVPASALVLAGYLYFSPSEKVSLVDKQDATQRTTAAPEEPMDAAILTAPSEGVGARPQALTFDDKREFREAQDLWSFAEQLLERAKAGEANAQYHLFRALSYCDTLYPFYFGRKGKRRTLDEGLQLASMRYGLSSDEARDVYHRCDRIEGAEAHPFGSANEWLEAAQRAGHALAMIDSAKLLATKAAVSGTIDAANSRKEAVRLAMEALASREPEVIFKFGDLATLFFGDTERASEMQWVWRLAACDRGYDCTSSAEWLKFQCRFDYNCQPNDDGVEYIRRNNSQNFDSIQSKAKDLSASLDANDLAGLFE
jgi:hypothetical protein